MILLDDETEIKILSPTPSVIDLTNDDSDTDTYIVSITKQMPCTEIMRSVSSIVQREKEFGHLNHSSKSNKPSNHLNNVVWDKICPICKTKDILVNYDVAICTKCNARFIFGRFHSDVMDLCREHCDVHMLKCTEPLLFMTFDNQYLFCYCNSCVYMSLID